MCQYNVFSVYIKRSHFSSLFSLRAKSLSSGQDSPLYATSYHETAIKSSGEQKLYFQFVMRMVVLHVDSCGIDGRATVNCQMVA